MTGKIDDRPAETARVITDTMRPLQAQIDAVAKLKDGTRPRWSDEHFPDVSYVPVILTIGDVAFQIAWDPMKQMTSLDVMAPWLALLDEQVMTRVRDEMRHLTGELRIAADGIAATVQEA